MISNQSLNNSTLRLEILPGEDSDKTKLGFYWNIKEFKN
jgi:hypothetical protein